MPGPGLYVAAVVVGVVAGVAFKEFVYDPHLAPKIEQWTSAYAAYRLEQRRKRAFAHTYSHLHSDNEDEGSIAAKSSIELEGLVKREMYTPGSERTLRQRKGFTTDANGLEMMEKPNAFIPFTPLSPTPLPSPSNPISPRDDAMPIGCFPTPQTSQATSSQVMASPVLSVTGVVQFHPQPLVTSDPFSHSSALQYQESSSNPSMSDSDVAMGARSPVSTGASHTASSMGANDFAGVAHSPAPHRIQDIHVVLSVSGINSAAASSRGPSPFTNASVSRAGTPWTDALSEPLSTDLQSTTSLSDDSSEAEFISDMEYPHPHFNLSLQPTAVYSQTSLNNHSAISLDSHSDVSLDASISSIDTRSDASLDFLGAEELQANPANMQSPTSTHGILSDDEWDRISEAGRLARQS